MPSRYPPITRQAATSPPTTGQAPAQPAQNNAQELSPDAGYAGQLAELARDRTRFLAVGHPIKDALHMALQQPAGVLLARYGAALRAYHAASAAPLDSDEPGERQAGTAADEDDRPAIVAFTETMVAKAILGDMQAAALVSDRIEGKAGLRRADVDAETQAQRDRVRAVIGELVRGMGERAAARREPLDITPDE